MQIDNNLSNNKTILITGGAGFIGSNLILYMLNKSPNYIINVDKLTYAADLNNLKSVKSHPNYIFEKIDIVNRNAVHKIFEKYKPDGVIHLAAESHVDNSIKDPQVFIYTNVVGTFNLLEEARQLWLQDKKLFQKSRFHYISTDEVYGSLDKSGYFKENTPYAPNSPYSATKASSDFLVRAYHKTYGMNVVITNCSNNFGAHQHDEKFIPTIIRSALNYKPIPVYGSGENVRDWLYVSDHCRAIDLAFHKGKSGETYNIGCHNEWRNIDLAKKICSLLDELKPITNRNIPITSYKSLITFVKDRPGHDLRYAIDSTKIKKQLGWTPKGNFEEKLKYTIKWYIRRYKK